MCDVVKAKYMAVLFQDPIPKSFMGTFSTSLLLLLLLLFFSFFSSSLSIPNNPPTLKGVDIENPILEVSPSVPLRHSASQDVKNTLQCERLRVSGISRLKLGSYSSSFRVTLAPSVSIPEKFHSRIKICFHRNDTLGWCQCENDEWMSVQKGVWNGVMSPYETRYVDVRITGKISGPVIIALKEDFQQWRLICLAVGFVLLLLAPIISSWVPFYYSMSTAVGIFVVILTILFQGMKLMPTGRKKTLYLTICGSVVRARSFVLDKLSLLLNSLFQSLGTSEEMFNLVVVFVILGIILAAAALGSWIVRRFVISKEDGSVVAGVAQFVKWAMRIIGTTFILQIHIHTRDPLLAIGSFDLLWSCLQTYFCHKIVLWMVQHSSIAYRTKKLERNDDYPFQWVRGRHDLAEFLSRSTPKGKHWKDPKGKLWNSPKKSAWSDSPVRGVVSPYSGIPSQSPGSQTGQDYYSTFHKTSNRKKFTKQEWDEFTRESTKQALAEWAASPEFTDWTVEHADRIKVLPSESSDETMGSELDSTDLRSGSGYRLFNWQ